MRAVPADTTPEAARVQIEILRRMSPEQRLETALELSDMLRETVASGVRHRHPEYSADQVNFAVMRLTLGDKLFRQVFPNVEIQP